MKNLTSRVTQRPEYELRHPSGEIDEFGDIGDAVDYRDNFGFKDSKLFCRMVTVVTVEDEWQEVPE